MGIKGVLGGVYILDLKFVDSTTIQFGDLSHTFIALSFQGKEKRFLWET